MKIRELQANVLAFLVRHRRNSLLRIIFVVLFQAALMASSLRPWWLGLAWVPTMALDVSMGVNHAPWQARVAEEQATLARFDEMFGPLG